MTLLQLTRAEAAGTSMFSRGYFRELARQDRLWILPLAVCGIAMGAGMAVFMLLQNYRGLLMLGQQIGHPEIMFFFSFLASGLFIFILSIPSSLSKIYHSNDSELLMSLPITPRQIVLSKTLLLYGFFLLLHLLFYLPAVHLFLAYNPVSIGWVVAAVIQGCAVPMVPLTLGIGTASLLAGGSSFSRHRMLFEILGMTLVLAALIGFQMLVSRQMLGNLSEIQLQADSLLVRFASRILRFLPPATWAARSVSGSLWHLPLSLLFSLAVSALLLFLISTRITTVLARRQESARRVKKTGRPAADKRVHKPTVALFCKEWAVLSSNSVFLFEAIGEVFVLPLILVIFSLVIPGEVMEMATGFLEDFDMKGLLVFALILFFTGINSISSTSLSREGSSFRLSLSLPFRGRVHLKAKLMFHLALFLPALTLDILVLAVILDLSFLSLLYLIPGGVAAIFFIFALTIAIDLKNPMLNWKHPQQAMKQNFNTLIGMGISFLAIICTITLGAGLFLMGLGEAMTGLLLALTLAVSAAILLKRAVRLAEKAYGGAIEIL